VIGRIFQTHHHPVDGLWKWNGGLPERFKGKPPMPNSAFETTAREASRKVEEYWEMAKEKAR